MKMDKACFELSGKWIYRNARPVDLARWQYHFERRSPELVTDALRAYQNDDGGFGHALEADAWNPNSSPIQTWAAAELLRETGAVEKESAMVQGILRYLDSGKDFVNGKWTNTVPTNNDFPHAPWWDWNEESDYNPTAHLCGFIIEYANPESGLYRKACKIAKAAVDSFMERDEIADGHLLLCYLRLKQSCEKMGAIQIFDTQEFGCKLFKHIKAFLLDVSLDWCCDGVATEFIRSYRDELQDMEIAKTICNYFIQEQRKDGTWNIPWEWKDYQDQWAVSENWWKAHAIIVNMLFLKQFNYL